MKLKTSTSLVLAAIAAMSAGSALAQAAAEPAPESTLSFNVGAVSDYRYRGISQSRLKPAAQGGIDYAHSSGLYVGTWASTIKWIKDSGATKGDVELDIYGGYKGAVGDVAYDLGVLRYQYVKNELGKVDGFVNANTTEVYGALTLGVITAKYSQSTTNLFGNANSKNSYYMDLSAALDLGGGYSLVPHVGYQYIKNVSAGTYTDYSLTLAKDLGDGWSASAMLVGTDAKESFYTLKNEYNGKSGVVVGLKYSF